MITSVKAIYFSPTGGTRKIARELLRRTSELFGVPASEYNFTFTAKRESPPEIEDGQLTIVATPVVAGRVPNLMVGYIESIVGGGGYAIPIVVCGGRAFDDALSELCGILTKNNFKILAGGGFVSQHAFSNTLQAGRPDASDLEKLSTVAENAKRAFESGTLVSPEQMGNFPPKPHFKPLSATGEHIDIRKVTPKTNDNCTECGVCVKVCPLGSISPADCRTMVNICMKCCACVKFCPFDAKYFDDEGFLYHIHDLENLYTKRRLEPIIF